MERLTDEEIQNRMAGLPTWQVLGDGLNRVYVFSNFDEAFAWMTTVAAYAKQIDHHPNWKNIYDRVAVTIYTHRAGGITDLDFQLAAYMEDLFTQAVGT